MRKYLGLLSGLHCTRGVLGSEFAPVFEMPFTGEYLDFFEKDTSVGVSLQFPSCRWRNG